MILEFKGKVALVTGAAGAIGKHVAQELLAGGAKVFITDLMKDPVEAVSSELGCTGMSGKCSSWQIVGSSQGIYLTCWSLIPGIIWS